MIDIAFYAPLKSPDHPTPSGDREMARSLRSMMTDDGMQARLVSDIRLYDKHGDMGLQTRLQAQAEAECTRLVNELSTAPPDVWVTYHNYYKAPDLIGPTVCEALQIPYVQFESTRARKRLTGKWATFAAAAEAASDAAQIVFYQTQQDAEALQAYRTGTQRLIKIAPFLPFDQLPQVANPAQNDDILTVAMMRAGDKMQSFALLAEALAQLTAPNWRLCIVGDGPAREQVQALTACFSTNVVFLGQLTRSELSQTYAKAGLFVWPGVNEAYGMVYLEAQAAGLPVVAQDRPGVRDVTYGGPHPDPTEGSLAVAQRIDALLKNPAQRQAEGTAARTMVAANHLQGHAKTKFRAAIRSLIGKQA